MLRSVLLSKVAGWVRYGRNENTVEYEDHLEIEDFEAPESVHVGEKFTVTVGYENPSSESVEIEARYFLCVNTPEEARDRGNSCYLVEDFSNTLEPGQGVFTTISPVIDSDVPEEYRVPGERGQGISLRTDGDRIGGVTREAPLELLAPVEGGDDSSPDDGTGSTNGTGSADGHTDDSSTDTETSIEDGTAGLGENGTPESGGESDDGSATESDGDASEEGLISPVTRDVLALVSASGLTLVTVYRYLLGRGDNP